MCHIHVEIVKIAILFAFFWYRIDLNYQKKLPTLMGILCALPRGGTNVLYQGSYRRGNGAATVGTVLQPLFLRFESHVLAFKTGNAQSHAPIVSCDLPGTRYLVYIKGKTVKQVNVHTVIDWQTS